MKPYKWRLYADNNVEQEVVDYLRRRMDVLWVRDNPKLRREQDDSFHYHNAKKLRRYLLTHDEGFWDDTNYPFQSCPGLIILPKKDASSAKLLVHLLQRLIDDYHSLPEPLYLDGFKIKLSFESVTLKGVDHDTQKKSTEAFTWQELGYKGNRQ